VKIYIHFVAAATAAVEALKKKKGKDNMKLSFPPKLVGN
jgi:hypothetical protein